MQGPSTISAPCQRLRRLVALGAVLGGLALVAAGCGGGGSSAAGVASLGSTTTTTSAPTSGGSRPSLSTAAAKVAKFASCMRSHGLANFPEPIVSSHGVSLRVGPGTGIDPKSPQFKAAQSACKKYLPSGGKAPTITPADQADYLKAVHCMRSHGIVGFPDPSFANGGVRFNLPKGMNPNTTAFRKARLICEKLIPAGLPYSS